MLQLNLKLLTPAFVKGFFDWFYLKYFALNFPLFFKELAQRCLSHKRANS